MKARQCWTVLADKAQGQCDQIQQEMSALKLRQDSLQASEARLTQLYTEYRERINHLGSESRGMQDAINERQFMQQLTALLIKVAQDLEHTHRTLQHTRQRWLQAEKEKLKMQALVEQDLRQQRAALQQREQKQLDELGVRQFNLKTAIGHA